MLSFRGLSTVIDPCQADCCGSKVRGLHQFTNLIVQAQKYRSTKILIIFLSYFILVWFGKKNSPGLSMFVSRISAFFADVCCINFSMSVKCSRY